MSFWINFGILLAIIIAATIGVIVTIIRYGKEEEYLDNPIAINFMSDFCDGRFIGVEKKVELGKEGRKIITLEPRDVDPRQLDNVKNVTVIVDKNKLISLPKGTSRDKNISIYLPPTVESFPKALKETMFGKMLMLLTAITDAENTEIAALQEGMKRQSQHIKDMAAGEVSAERITQITEIYDDLLSASRENKRDRFPSPGTMTPPAPPR